MMHEQRLAIYHLLPNCSLTRPGLVLIMLAVDAVGVRSAYILAHFVFALAIFFFFLSFLSPFT